MYYLIRLWESLAGEERFKANKVVLVAIGETFRKANN